MMMKTTAAALLALSLLATACQNDMAQPKDDAPPTGATSAPADAAEAPAKEVEAPKADAPKGDACKDIASATDATAAMQCVDVFQGGEQEVRVLKTQAELDALIASHGERCKERKPAFDFEKVSLIGTVVSGACSVKVDAKACMAAAGPVLSVEYSEEGDCEIMAIQVAWVAIPKMTEGQIAGRSARRKP